MRIFLTLLILLLTPSVGLAEPWQIKKVQSRPAAFISGFLTGYAVHELGHIVVAESLGFNAEFDGLTIVYPESEMTDAEHLQVASSGFQAQWLFAEAALRYREKNEMGEFGDSYNAGVIVSHLAITAAYITVLMHHEDGDVQGISDATGASNEQTAALLAVPAILDTWRLFGTEVPAWVPTVSLGSKAVGLSVIWTW